eukprot:CAMPEP_0201903006 /NCGR_PEP_ID=MMETSP0902-20130614/55254_1 /ASSEMBLY_ACC=CAM_ASM_000551 /TAXON_ID=420261 /ORGANISM="Thalassiosira antarctica, Strain CCMP982" /LENGTH=41 /DNA_ID= /DNA_START= /DNA_END= /DNA_ORIENTATION=
MEKTPSLYQDGSDIDDYKITRTDVSLDKVWDVKKECRLLRW